MDIQNLPNFMDFTKEELAAFTPPKFVGPSRAEFLSTYQNQRFSLPNSIIYYILKNPSKSNVYEKLIQTCKYFFIKNPILLVKHVPRNDTLNNTVNKIWFTEEYFMHCFNQEIFSSIFSKIYRCNASTLILSNLSITFDEFLVFSGSAITVDLRYSTVKYANGKDVELEVLLQSCPKVIDFSYEFPENPENLSINSIKKLVKIPHFAFMKRFNLACIPDTFDLKTFMAFRKKTTMEVELSFREDISEKFQCLLNFLEAKNSFFGSIGYSIVRW